MAVSPEIDPVPGQLRRPASTRLPVRAGPESHVSGNGSAHYSVGVVPARPPEPRDKAKVEVGVPDPRNAGSSPHCGIADLFSIAPASI